MCPTTPGMGNEHPTQGIALGNRWWYAFCVWASFVKIWSTPNSFLALIFENLERSKFSRTICFQIYSGDILPDYWFRK
jgi:hypothetical protein